MTRKSAKANLNPVRQRTQYTCMSTSMCMALNALGHECDEDEVNKVMGARPMKGAAWEQALACAQHYGVRGTLVCPSTVNQLKEWCDAGKPVMIAWNPEGREWSHASVVFDVTEDPEHGLLVHVADPNIPDPDETVRVVPKGEFYQKWYEKWPNYLVRRPALMLDREITPEGRQVMAGMRKSAARRGPPAQTASAALLKRQGYTPVDVMFGEALPHRRPIVTKGDGVMDRRGNVMLFAGIAGDGSPILAKDDRELERLSDQIIKDRLHVITATKKLRKIRSLQDLYGKAKRDPAYLHLLKLAAENLGHYGSANFDAWVRTLENNALESGDSGMIVDEVNFVLDIAQDDLDAGRVKSAGAVKALLYDVMEEVERISGRWPDDDDFMDWAFSGAADKFLRRKDFEGAAREYLTSRRMASAKRVATLFAKSL